MGIQINGQTDTISASDGGLSVSGMELSSVTSINASGIGTFSNGPVLIGSATSTGTATQRLQVTGGAYVSGNLGIGTTNPSQLLDVRGGNISVTGGLVNVLRVDTTYPKISISDSSANDTTGDVTISGYYPIIFKTDTGFERMRVSRTGDVGIGTASPANALDVVRSSGEAVIGVKNAGTGSSWVTFTPGSAGGAYLHNTTNSPMVFTTNGTERARISGTGNFGIGAASPGAKLYVSQSSTPRTATFYAESASYAELIIFAQANRSASTSYQYFQGYNASTGDIDFRLMGDGNAYADLSWNGGGADYAEMFEWSDGNPDNEDRRGCTVSLVGDKIKIAEEGEVIIGAISGNPSVVGDAAWNKWSGKYLTDDYGSHIFEEHNVVEWTDEDGKQHSYEDWNLPEGLIIPESAVIKTHDDKGNRFTHRKLNPEYNKILEYIPREERPEWDTVGLVGKLRVRKGQVIDSRWVKMKDISATVEEWLVR